VSVTSSLFALTMNAYVIIVCVLLCPCWAGVGYPSSLDRRGRRRAAAGRAGRDSAGEAGYCELAVTCRGQGDDDSGAVNHSSPVRLPIRGRRGMPGPPGRKGDTGPPGELITVTSLYLPVSSCQT